MEIPANDGISDKTHQEHEIDSEELSFLLEQIKISSNEMDTVVRKIVENTKTVD